MESVLIWTASNVVNDTARRVNPAPDGSRWISQRPYTPEQAKEFQRQYDGGDAWSGQVIVRSFYARCPDGTLVAEERSSEHYFEASDFVVSAAGELIGFLVKENLVLWRADFAPGGCHYDGDGVLLHHYGDRVELGYLGYSRW